MYNPAMIPISTVERETGLSKDTLRKWEERYGFPRPKRNLNGERHYVKDDLVRLTAIKRLLDSGMRPAQVVPLSPAEIDDLSAKRCISAVPGPQGEIANEVWTALKNYSHSSLKDVLSRSLLAHGLRHFVLDSLTE